MDRMEAHSKAHLQQETHGLTNEQTTALQSLYVHGAWPHGATDSSAEEAYEQLTVVGLARHGRRTRLNGRTHFSYIPARRAA